MTTGGIAFTYVSLLFAYWVPALVWCLAIGAIWTILGFVLKGSDGPLRAAVTGLAEFAESLMRLLVNSFSFARIGAFALAHAGLSSAIIGVGEAAGSVGYWIVLILGNLLIICLEGLVTGIQTTRLVLFEFFIRFFKAGGREFHPLNPPALASRNPLEM